MTVSITPKKNIDDRINETNRFGEPMITRLRMIKLVNDIYRAVEQINIVIPASDVSFDPTGTDYSATNVQDALVENWDWWVGNEQVNSAIHQVSGVSWYAAGPGGTSIYLNPTGDFEVTGYAGSGVGDLFMHHNGTGGFDEFYMATDNATVDAVGGNWFFTGGGAGSTADWNGLRLTGLADGIAGTDAATVEQLTAATSTPYSRIFMLMGAAT